MGTEKGDKERLFKSFSHLILPEYKVGCQAFLTDKVTVQQYEMIVEGILNGFPMLCSRKLSLPHRMMPTLMMSGFTKG